MPMRKQATVSQGLAQGPYVAARVEFEPATLWTQGTELTTEPPCPTPIEEKSVDVVIDGHCLTSLVSCSYITCHVTGYWH